MDNSLQPTNCSEPFSKETDAEDNIASSSFNKKGCLVGCIIFALLFLLFLAISSCSASSIKSNEAASKPSSLYSSTNTKTVDKGPLNNAIETAKLKVQEDYSVESWALFNEALLNAEKISSSSNATEEQIQSALTSLIEASRNLIEIFDTIHYPTMPFEDVSRNPSTYTGKKMSLVGIVLQVQEGAVMTYLRIATKGNYDDVVLVSYASIITESRILEGDKIQAYGICEGITSYESVLGKSITLPSLLAKKIELIK